MPPRIPSVARATHVELRDALARADGWRALRPRAFSVALEGRQHRFTPLAARGRRRALLCDPGPGSTLPDYAARRRLRALVRSAGPDPVLIFADASDSERVWTWVERGPGQRAAYREKRCAAGPCPPGLVDAVSRAGRRGERGFLRSPRASDAGTRVLSLLLQRLRWRHPHPHDLAGARNAMVELVERTEEPGQLRAVWGALRRLRVLDQGSGSGVWLLGAMDALDPVYTACLHRMEVWLGERTASSRGSRGRLRDFAAVVTRAGDAARHPSPRAYVREAILLRNLYGVFPSPASASKCRRRLLRAIGERAEEPHLLEPFCNVRVGRWQPPEGTGGDPLCGLARLRLPEGTRAILRQAESLGRAERLVRRLRLETGAGSLEVASALAALARRRMLLWEQLDRLPAGTPAAVLNSLRMWIHFPEPLLDGGFCLVRRA